MHVSKQRRTPYRLHLHRNKSSQQKKKILFLWSNGRERTHTPILTFFLSHAVRMNERIGVVSAPLEGRVETKARVCWRRVRCRSQKGPSQKNRDVSWRGREQPGRVSEASLVNGAPFHYTREHHPSTILISSSLSPRAAYGSPLFQLSLYLSL